jgi:hypothetical protein
MAGDYKDNNARTITRHYNARMEAFHRKNCPCASNCPGRNAWCKVDCERWRAYQTALSEFRRTLKKDCKTENAVLSTRFETLKNKRRM